MADVADWHFSAARSRFTAQILDEWGAVIVNINERTFPSKPYGKFLLVKPGFRGAIPIDAARIELHSSKAKMLGRVEIKGGPEGAVAARSHFGVQERCIDYNTAPYLDHWLCANFGGNRGQLPARTAANFAGIWANSPSEAVYFAATRDADEQPLSGSNSRVMHFPADKLPELLWAPISR